MTYPQALNYLNSFVNYEWLNCYPYPSSFRLARVSELLQFLANPQQKLRIIHVAGTKGKGSTCAFIANILKAAGLKVGLYTSPHLIDLRERIKILQPAASNRNTTKEAISKRDFARLLKKIRPYAEELRSTALGKLSYFELLTSLALLYFQKERTDFVVLETGIGGRLDATNVTEAAICAITPISYEHTHVLGNSLRKIAQQKAAIIKRSTRIAVIAPQQRIALGVIKKQAAKLGTELLQVGRDIQLRPRSFDLNKQIFDVQSRKRYYPKLKIRLLGRHQLINALTAIGCIESLYLQGVKISPQLIRVGLTNTRWPGRLQIIAQRPKIVLDVAHNQASARAIKDTLKNVFKFDNLILVFAASADKDVAGILKELLPIAATVILTKTGSPRAMTPRTISGFVPANKRPIIITENSARALRLARGQASARDLILVCGSLFLIGEILKAQKQW